jgi:tRNA pseudouridine55 synthase
VDLGAEGPVAVFDVAGEFLALYEQRDAAAVPVAVFTS